MTGATPVWDPHFIETLEGSFSRPLIVGAGAFSEFVEIFKICILFAPLEARVKKKLENRPENPNENTRKSRTKLKRYDCIFYAPARDQANRSDESGLLTRFCIEL